MTTWELSLWTFRKRPRTSRRCFLYRKHQCLNGLLHWIPKVWLSYRAICQMFGDSYVFWPFLTAPKWSLDTIEIERHTCFLFPSYILKSNEPMFTFSGLNSKQLRVPCKFQKARKKIFPTFIIILNQWSGEHKHWLIKIFSWLAFSDKKNCHL